MGRRCARPAPGTFPARALDQSASFAAGIPLQCYDGGSAAEGRSGGATRTGGGPFGAITFFALADDDGAAATAANDGALALRCARQLAGVWASSHGLQAEAQRLVTAVAEAAKIAEVAEAATAEATGVGRGGAPAGAQFAVQRWPREAWVSDDAAPGTIHPHPAPVASLALPDWGGVLVFAGTESDQAHPGVLEGAIGSAHAALKRLRL